MAPRRQDKRVSQITNYLEVDPSTREARYQQSSHQTPEEHSARQTAHAEEEAAQAALYDQDDRQIARVEDERNAEDDDYEEGSQSSGSSQSTQDSHSSDESDSESSQEAEDIPREHSPSETEATVDTVEHDAADGDAQDEEEEEEWLFFESSQEEPLLFLPSTSQEEAEDAALCHSSQEEEPLFLPSTSQEAGPACSQPTEDDDEPLFLPSTSQEAGPVQTATEEQNTDESLSSPPAEDDQDDSPSSSITPLPVPVPVVVVTTAPLQRSRTRVLGDIDVNRGARAVGKDSDADETEDAADAEADVGTDKPDGCATPNALRTPTRSTFAAAAPGTGNLKTLTAPSPMRKGHKRARGQDLV